MRASPLVVSAILLSACGRPSPSREAGAPTGEGATSATGEGARGASATETATGGQGATGEGARGASATKPSDAQAGALAIATGDDGAGTGSPGEPAGAASSGAVDVLSGASRGWRTDAGVPTLSTADTELDGAEARARTRARLASDRSPVVVTRGGTPREMGERLCARVVPPRPKGALVLLKPNIGGFDWFKDPAKSDGDDGVAGRVTDPEFVRGVIQCLRRRGHTRVVVADGWGGGHTDWRRLAEVSGYARLAREEGVQLVALNDDGVFDREGDRPGAPVRVAGMEASGVPTLLAPRMLAEALRGGLFLSLPKVKAHRFAVVSVGVKGMQGVVMLADAAPAHRQKARMHRELNEALAAQRRHAPDARALYVKALETFAERMVDVLEVLPPDAVLAEGAPAMGGDGFQKLYPSEERYAVGGTNPVLVDRVAAELLGLWDNAELARELGGHRTSPLVTAAARRFGIDLTGPRVEGDGAALLGAPRSVHYVAMAGFAIHAEARAQATPEAHALALNDAEAPDEARWGRAAPVRWDTDTSGAATGVATQARFAWSPRALHVRFDLASAGLNTDTSRPIEAERPRLYDEDCVELFLAPDSAVRERYAEVEVGPYGHFLDLWIDRTAKKENVAWSSSPRIVTRRDAAARTATLEIAIAAPEIVAALRPGARLPLGLFRMEGRAPDRRYLAWSPPRTPRPNFHVPAAFGALVLDPP